VEDRSGPPPWLWKGAVLALTLALAGGLALSVAICAGWNSPRPTASPGWRLSGPLLLEVASSEQQVVVPLERPVRDFSLEAVATPLDGPDFNGYGLAFRLQEPERYAVFAVGGDGYLAVLHVGGGVETALLDWQQFPHVRRGRAANRLRLSCVGGTCHFWINDEYVASLSDVLGPVGDVGLWAHRFGEEQVRVEFSQVALWHGGR
jgi:hypothetical protein